nr:hypothetical protein [Vibrio navarrensis]
MIVLCSLGSLVWCFSASWLQWTRFSGQLFFGAGNSANCLNQFSGKREVQGSRMLLTHLFIEFWDKIFRNRLN